MLPNAPEVDPNRKCWASTANETCVDPRGCDDRGCQLYADEDYRAKHDNPTSRDIRAELITACGTNALAEMSKLPDISGEDSERLRQFVEVTAIEVKAVGGASAGTTLEMIGYIRELEHELRSRAAAPPDTPCPEQWVCFHCNTVLTGRGEAESHFGVGRSVVNMLPYLHQGAGEPECQRGNNGTTT